MLKFELKESLTSKSDSCIIVICGKDGLASADLISDHASLHKFIEANCQENGDHFSQIDDQGIWNLFVYLDPAKPMIDMSKIVRSLLIKNKQFLGEHTTCKVYSGIYDPGLIIPSLVLACSLSTNSLGRYKSGKNGGTAIKQVQIYCTGKYDKNTIQSLINTYAEIADVQLKLMTLVNTPANFKTPAIISDQIKTSAEKYQYKCTVMDENDLKQHQMDAILSVSKGSAVNPRFLILEYGKSSANYKSIGLVGKGVTFDTGGISLKNSANLHMMKSDMAGAALVACFVELAARLNLDCHIIAALPLTENCIDGASLKPGDVINSYSAKTIEIIDTDAEGRLILADALAYLTKNYKLDHLIDFATLTGSVIQALGYHTAGLYSNDDHLANQLVHAGQQAVERCWPMPIWDLYADDMKSDLADIKNLSSKPVAGSITAAIFLKEFINDHPSWAHLDIAGMAFTDNEYGNMRNASGYGLRLLYNFVTAL